MDDLDGFAFADRVRAIDPAVSLIFMIAWPTTANAVDAVGRHGGIDYLKRGRSTKIGCFAWCRKAPLGASGVAAKSSMGRLTAREREVLVLLVDGHRNKAVADRLRLLSKTVEDHRAAVLAKTGAVGIAGLIELVRRGA